MDTPETIAPVPVGEPAESWPHKSVLLDEVLGLLKPRPDAKVLDATLGAGGHAARILAALSSSGCLYGMDVDPQALALAQRRLRALALPGRVALHKANFRLLAQVAEREHWPPLDGILVDLGVSSMQFDQVERGFSFRSEAPLDLRMDPELPHTGADLLETLPEKELADLIFTLGDERGSRAIARRIIQERAAGRPIRTTSQLAKLVCSALHIRHHQRIHPATRTFQALRMAVNQELDALGEFLAHAPDLLAPGGVLAVIAFHSGEDRMVKHSFKGWAASGLFDLSEPRLIRPGEAEEQANPRCRSARLRGLIRTEAVSARA